MLDGPAASTASSVNSLGGLLRHHYARGSEPMATGRQFRRGCNEDNVMQLVKADREQMHSHRWPAGNDCERDLGLPYRR
jgi:hypothetical protein